MGRIDDLARALERGRRQYEELMASQEWVDFAPEERYDLRQSRLPEDPGKEGDRHQLRLDAFGGEEESREATGEPQPERGRIGAGDNLDYMVWLLKDRDLKGKLQLIYVDPPFFSGARYQASVQLQTEKLGKSDILKAGAYSDRWEGDLENYLQMLAVRFYLMRELLSDTGILWVHLDWHGAHVVKLMLDEIFGEERFVNEVIWTYKSGGAGKRSFAKKHDTLLAYSKTGDYTFHPLKEKSYNREGKPYRFKGVEEFEDEGGWYTMVNMKDVWTIDMVGRTSKERMGYATQKPEKLVERIVESCSDPGDLCADFFAGTGTLGVVCAKMDRRWIMCDEGSVAVADQILRMASREGAFTVERPQTGPVRPEPTEESKIFPRADVDSEGGYVYLSGYHPDMSLVRREDRETVFWYLSEDRLCLIRFWSVDQEKGDDSVHRSRRLLAGGDVCPLNPPSEETEEQRQEGPGKISIVGYDVFGGRFRWQGEIEENR